MILKFSIVNVYSLLIDKQLSHHGQKSYGHYSTCSTMDIFPMKIITKDEHLSLQTKMVEVAIEMILKHSSVNAEV